MARTYQTEKQELYMWSNLEKRKKTKEKGPNV